MKTCSYLFKHVRRHKVLFFLWQLAQDKKKLTICFIIAEKQCSTYTRWQIYHTRASFFPPATTMLSSVAIDRYQGYQIGIIGANLAKYGAKKSNGTQLWGQDAIFHVVQYFEK